MKDSTSLGALVAEIGAMAGRPLDDALTLPPDAYRSEDLLALEIERIFAREWICAGRADEIPLPGDYLTFDLSGEPMLIVRGNDGAVRALSNVCRHRWTLLKTDRGRATSFQCPYHAWTYDLGGRLIGAPFMDRTADFDLASCRLPELRVELWSGFIYVNLDDDAPPLAPRLTELARVLDHYRLAEMGTVVGDAEAWDCNWKAAAENAMESYHLFKVHKDTLEPFFPTADLEMHAGGVGYNLHRGPMRDGLDYPGAGPEAASANPDLTAAERRSLWLACIYPSHIIAVSAGSLVWIAVQPIGVGRSRVRWGYAQPGELPSADSEEGIAYRAAVKQGVELINSQDRGIVTLLQRGVVARRAGRGRLGHFDWPVWEFGKYLARRLV